jgi:hypothetical protein
MGEAVLAPMATGTSSSHIYHAAKCCLFSLHTDSPVLNRCATYLEELSCVQSLKIFLIGFMKHA